MNGYGAPLGKNLEAACKSWKAQDDARKEREAEAAYMKKMEDAWEKHLQERAEPKE